MNKSMIKKTASSINIVWICANVLSLSVWTYYKKSLLMPIIYIYIIIWIYISRYFHTHTYINTLPAPRIHLYNLVQSYIWHYLRAVPSTTQEKILTPLIKTYPGYITFSLKFPVGYLHLVLHPVVRALHLVTHGITENLNMPRSRHQEVLRF